MGWGGVGMITYRSAGTTETESAGTTESESAGATEALPDQVPSPCMPNLKE